MYEKNLVSERFSEKVNLIHINLFLILPITICYFVYKVVMCLM